MTINEHYLSNVLKGKSTLFIFILYPYNNLWMFHIRPMLYLKISQFYLTICFNIIHIYTSVQCNTGDVDGNKLTQTKVAFSRIVLCGSHCVLIPSCPQALYTCPHIFRFGAITVSWCANCIPTPPPRLHYSSVVVAYTRRRICWRRDTFLASSSCVVKTRWLQSAHFWGIACSHRMSAAMQCHLGFTLIYARALAAKSATSSNPKAGVVQWMTLLRVDLGCRVFR